jgi:cAMP-dependent protein kinase regulator
VDSEAQVAPDVLTKADNDEDEDEDDDDDDFGEDGPDDIPPPPVKMSRGQRRSVSAEAFGVFNQRSEDWEAPVYDKTSEQKSRIQKCLESSFLFNALEKQELDTLVLAFKEAKVQAGDRVIQQGDDGESMYLLETGVVDCLKTIEGEEKVVKTCNGGEVFGELALLYNCPRAASVVAKEEATLWELDRETFNRIVKDAASKKRDQYSEFLKKVPLLKNVDAYECMTMADALKVEAHEAQDTQVIKLGDLGDKFYIVLEGECVAKTQVSQGIEQIVMTHKVGDYFGELSLIKNQPRAAHVYTSMPDTKLLWMNRSTFKRLLGPVEDILRREAVGRYESKSPPASPSA